MAVKFNLVKKLVREDVINTNQLILNSLFGNILPDQYDENKVYNKGDVIIRINEEGMYELLVCTKDNITGPFNEDYWSPISFTDMFKDSSVITQNNTTIKNIQEGMADDLATLVYNLAGLLDNDMDFNQIFSIWKNSPCIRCSSMLSTFTGRKVPSPTWRVTSP